MLTVEWRVKRVETFYSPLDGHTEKVNAMMITDFYRIEYENGKENVSLLVTDEESGAFHVIERTPLISNPRCESGYCPHVFLSRVYNVGDVEVEHSVLVLQYYDIAGLAKNEKMKSISAMINYSTTLMYVALTSDKDADEFVTGYSLI